jgi:hypothetical protein
MRIRPLSANGIEWHGPNGPEWVKPLARGWENWSEVARGGNRCFAIDHEDASSPLFEVWLEDGIVVMHKLEDLSEVECPVWSQFWELGMPTAGSGAQIAKRVRQARWDTLRVAAFACSCLAGFAVVAATGQHWVVIAGVGLVCGYALFMTVCTWCEIADAKALQRKIPIR